MSTHPRCPKKDTNIPDFSGNCYDCGLVCDERMIRRNEVDREKEEPGTPICDVTCPCCGALLEITIGDDEGELSVVGTPMTEE